ncbi:MAG: hypothetical protein LUB59_03995, partial [Candidatus Gastranaerophilales bacterium]|nr:hypothetical protein [Candidatus Gastranaerophilales bacterium]
STSFIKAGIISAGLIIGAGNCSHKTITENISKTNNMEQILTHPKDGTIVANIANKNVYLQNYYQYSQNLSDTVKHFHLDKTLYKPVHKGIAQVIR